jgi:seryl-tRNA synthetase
MTDESDAYRVELLGEGILFSLGVDGLYGKSASYQAVADGINHRVAELGRELGATVMHLPPLESRHTFEETNYLQSFPDMVGSVDVFTGTDRDHIELLQRLDGNKDWWELMEGADVVLCPSACHSAYPQCTGTLPAGGRRFAIRATCFRNEPSGDPVRMRSFEQHELVYVGHADQALAYRDQWVADGLGLLGDLGLEVAAETANDPFFGRLGRMLATDQLEAGLKVEVVSSLYSGTTTALLSANYHRDHFGTPFSIETADGEVAHSACVGFGIDRIVLALFRTHGLDPRSWPTATQKLLSS